MLALGFGKRSITDTEGTAISFMERLRELSLQLSRKNIGAQRSLRTRALRRSGPGCLEGAASTTGTCRWALKREPRRCRGRSRRPASPGSDKQPDQGVRWAVHRLGLGSSRETRSAAAPPGGVWRCGSHLPAVPGEPSGEPSWEPNGAPGGRGAGMGRRAAGGSDSARPGPATCAKGGPSRGPGLPTPPDRAATGRGRERPHPSPGSGTFRPRLAGRQSRASRRAGALTSQDASLVEPSGDPHPPA